ncbi:MAG: hypothetical protein ABL916_16420, partial [Burkholderiaceae bacterium]
LFAPPALAAHPPHLVPCVACGALNGRSALACWSCEADLIALAPFAQPAANRQADHPVEPAPAATTVTVTVEASDGRRGLHLVSRGEAPVSIETAPAMPVPAELPDLPVLTALVEDTALSEDTATGPAAPAPLLKARRPDRPMIAVAFVAFALLAAAAGLRWFAPVPAVVLPAGPAPAALTRDEARLERPFAAPAPVGAPDAAELTFPPVDVAPGAATTVPPTRAATRNRAAPPPRAPSAAPRPAPKPREIRETISPPPAACTSNMAALGFCTLPPASTKE